MINEEQPLENPSDEVLEIEGRDHEEEKPDEIGYKAPFDPKEIKIAKA